MISSWDVITLGFLGSLAAGMMTAVGAAGIVFIRQLSSRSEDILLSAAAGIMLAAAIFSLLLPGIDQAQTQGHSQSNAVLIVLAGMLLGATLLALIHHYTPHQHFQKPESNINAKKLQRIWLFILAITLHNFPEGMAVGVGFANGDIDNGLPLAIGIGLQNIPEGLAVAVSLMAVGYSRLYSFGVATLTGLLEPIGGLFGATLIAVATPLMPWILGGAAGAMLFIISDEIIPETHRRNHEGYATFSLLGGFSIMMYLDTVLG
ncbi:ZIP family metal transporter [Gilvimarinus polysaccharolyticus]|uniref:ZIP family metal transporter n=1 Tax=Gilvimarinus polysaccharolyticus TaxID=863921 RepID=UPI0006732316|nr:ZIP family metal transporter [Gilvimarinus polysaccharolyticus]